MPPPGKHWPKCARQRDSTHSEPVLYVRGNDGDYYQKGGGGIYEHTPKAFNTFLENKNLFISGQSSPEPETEQGRVTYKAKNGTYTLTYNNVDNYGR